MAFSALYMGVLVRAAKTKSHRLGGLNNCGVLSHRFGDRKSKIKVSAVWVPSKSEKENLFQACHLAFAGLLKMFGVPWPVEASRCVYMSPNFSFL